METANEHKLFVGVDISATTVMVAWLAPGLPSSQPISLPQTPQAFTLLQKRLCALGYQPVEILIVMEATGSYWMALAMTLAQAGFGVSIV